MIRIKIREIFIFILLFLSFLIIIFFLKNFVFDYDKNNLKEEKFLLETEKSEEKKDFESATEVDLSSIIDKLKKEQEEENKKKIAYTFFPSSLILEEEFLEYKKMFDTFFFSLPINEKIKVVQIYFFKEDFWVRWRLKDKKISLYGIYLQKPKEALSVWIHEFWHFYDIYILMKWVFKDLSYDFYNISWNERNILKNGSKNFDFVSGYAMSNMYEDFAESFNFYILHNKEFQRRAKKSEKLQKKYDFIRKYIFIKWEFQDWDYELPIGEEYIWDTTKQDYNFEKFKVYLDKF